jgi:hypothetical protein
MYQVLINSVSFEEAACVLCLFSVVAEVPGWWHVASK